LLWGRAINLMSRRGDGMEALRWWRAVEGHKQFNLRNLRFPLISRSQRSFAVVPRGPL
jgi:hypothetical protein